MKKFVPKYIRTISENRIKQKIERAYEQLKDCTLCGRYCRVNRAKGGKGFCRTGPDALISSSGPHHGEESPLVGRGGSGTIFFANCNLGCIFCQNYDISQMGVGERYDAKELAKMMLKVQKTGCENVNLVTPTHQMPVILKALEIAAGKGLDLPLVWNCGGYESPEALEILDGVVDIYMPDFKFWDEEAAEKYANASNYPEVARCALKIMHKQVGDLVIDEDGISRKGLLVRHLVMPNNVSGTDKFLKWLAGEVSPNTYVNVMRQYRPCYRASKYEEINRSITDREYCDALECARELGFRLDCDVAPRRKRFFLFDL